MFAHALRNAAADTTASSLAFIGVTPCLTDNQVPNPFHYREYGGICFFDTLHIRYDGHFGLLFFPMSFLQSIRSFPI
jgi:hypothetical protein|tara:strand:+ start:1134 stop:1364 length:231 start_codon:yes stop_codon:yes gene_type:complete